MDDSRQIIIASKGSILTQLGSFEDAAWNTKMKITFVHYFHFLHFYLLYEK